jgi:hypothetical protein
MSDWVEIKLERQVGGWVWFAVSTAASSSAPRVLEQSGETFPTEDAAWDDARKALKELRGPSRPDG